MTQPWELTDAKELQDAYDKGWAEETRLWVSGGGPDKNGDMESGREHEAGQRAIATAAQKKLVEWLKARNCEDEEIIGDLIIDHVTWSEVKAALGVSND